MGRRRKSKAFVDFIKELEKRRKENPVINQYDEIPEKITTHENTKELHEILVQTCIDYINKNNLTDIDCVSFNVDGLVESAKEGKWMPASDSYLGLFCVGFNCLERKNGDIDKMQTNYLIDESY